MGFSMRGIDCKRYFDQKNFPWCRKLNFFTKNRFLRLFKKSSLPFVSICMSLNFSDTPFCSSIILVSPYQLPRITRFSCSRYEIFRETMHFFISLTIYHDIVSLSKKKKSPNHNRPPKMLVRTFSTCWLQKSVLKNRFWLKS